VALDVARTPPSAYAELRREVRESGLLRRQPVYYTVVILRTLALLAACILVLLLVNNPAIKILDAVFLAMVSAQIGFIGHDAAHRQVFPRAERNDALGLVALNLLLGGSNASWKSKHNQHHSSPNQLGQDPDISVPIIAFAAEQAVGKQGLVGLVVKYQAWLLVPMLTIEWLSLRLASYKFLILHKPKGLVVETALIATHCILYFGLIFWALGLWKGLLFAGIHHAVLGVYVGATFAPNHKGMPILHGDTQLDFLQQQVLTSRNLRRNSVTDFLSGGLSCQIEHHLFPTMPRNNLRRAASIIRAFCEERSIPYVEMGAWATYGEIFRHLHEVGAPLRG
jgi:fatty acid desaturase